MSVIAMKTLESVQWKWFANPLETMKYSMNKQILNSISNDAVDSEFNGSRNTLSYLLKGNLTETAGVYNIRRSLKSFA
jgi:hypothetical protein